MITLVLNPSEDPLLPVRITVCTAAGHAETRYLTAEDAALIQRVATDRHLSLARLRKERRWTQAEFCRVVEHTSRRYGPTLPISTRQVRRWESPHPPRPQPPYVRVLEALFGIPITLLGFPPPDHHRRPDRETYGQVHR